MKFTNFFKSKFKFPNYIKKCFKLIYNTAPYVIVSRLMNNLENNKLISRHKTESYWRYAFNKFAKLEEKDCDSIDIPTSIHLIRSLGFAQITRDSFLSLVKKELTKGQEKGIEIVNIVDINCHMFCQIMQNLTDNRTRESEIQTAFRLLDYDNNGYISDATLKHAIQKLKEMKDDMNDPDIVNDIDSITHENIQSMIESFDSNLDSKISFDEFKHIWDE